MDDAQARVPDTLADALKTIDQLRADNERLTQQLEGQEFANELRAAFGLAVTTGIVGAPVSHSRLMELVVETAAHVIGSQAASLFLIDEGTEELVFEVALGQKADEVKKFRLPLGYGIAGTVAVTGTPIVTGDAQHDSRHAADLAKSIGYLPQSIVCVPLRRDGRIVGVLELLDKTGGSTFDAKDVEALEKFAEQATVALEQARAQQDLWAMVNEVITAVAGPVADRKRRLQERARPFTAGLEGELEYRRALDLARLVQEVARSGDDGFEECQAVLRRMILEHRARSRPSEACSTAAAAD